MAAITKDAVRIALFAGHTVLGQKDIEQAFLQQWMGIENPIEEMAPDQRRQIAVHEAGHAVAQHYLLPDQRIVHLTIVARAQSLGFMLPLDQVEMYSYPLRRIVADIMIGMAGHVATRIVFGEEWTGAYSDFQQVRAHLRHLQSLGFFGPPVSEPGAESPGRMDKILGDFWKDLDSRVETLLRAHCGKLIALADNLLKRSSLSRNDVLAILEPAPCLGGGGRGGRRRARAGRSAVVLGDGSRHRAMKRSLMPRSTVAVLLLLSAAAVLLQACLPGGMTLPQSPALKWLERKSGRIAYVALDGNVRTADQAGGAPKDVTTDAAVAEDGAGESFFYQFPAWSPDGRLIAFVGVRRTTETVMNTGIWTAPSDGQPAARVYSGDDRCPGFFHGRRTLPASCSSPRSAPTSSSWTRFPRRAARFGSSAKAWPSRGGGRRTPRPSPCIQ